MGDQTKLPGVGESSATEIEKSSRSGPKRASPAYQISHVEIQNWRNFKSISVDLSKRTFIVGPNASGKSNLLDALHFLKDVAEKGLSLAVAERDGISKIRALSAGGDPRIIIDVTLVPQEAASEFDSWRYRLVLNQDNNRNPKVVEEKAWRNGSPVLTRPDSADTRDELRLTQTALQQITANQDFREIADFFRAVRYSHLVPVLIKNPKKYVTLDKTDEHGRGLLEKIAGVRDRTRDIRLESISEALKIVVPNLEDLQFVRDPDSGEPHLQARYRHWRPRGAYQTEVQFSDGTLRLIGLLWSLLDGDGLLLLEEPELSLHAGVVRQLAPMIHTLQNRRGRQVIISTHSADLLQDPGIDGREVLLLKLGPHGTEVVKAAETRDVRALLDSGISISDAVIPWTEPPNLSKLDDFV